MNKFLFTNEITDKVIEVVSRIDVLKSVVKGDLSKVPEPELFKQFLPMAIIKPINVRTEWANITDRILHSTYDYKIFYLKHYDFENQIELLNLHEICIEESQPIAEILMDNLTLDDFKLDNGYVTHALVENVTFSSANFDFFRELQVPLALVEIDYYVCFRTYSNKMRRP